jgi:hypothetical protein
LPASFLAAHCQIHRNPPPRKNEPTNVPWIGEKKEKKGGEMIACVKEKDDIDRPATLAKCYDFAQMNRKPHK